jgi:hypothetical protein
MGRNRRRASERVRFWTWNLGPVRLSLAPGQRLRHSSGGPTEEGWSQRLTTFTHEGDRIVRDWLNDGCDCDGRLTQGGRDSCTLRNLDGNGPVSWLEPEYQDRDALGLPIQWPAWATVDSRRRDYQAEAAGY